METTSVLIAGSAVLLVTYMWGQLTSRDLPPSPVTALPVVGNLFSIDPRNFPKQAQQWREKVGDVFRLRLGSNLLVVLNGYDIIKEALVKKGEDFSDRPPFYFDWAYGMDDCGIIMHSGPNWKEQRTVTLSILRTLGMGKNVMADVISNEVLAYCSVLKATKGQPTDIRLWTNQSTGNVICSMMIGERFEYDDPTFKRIVEILNYNITHILGPAASLLQFFPIFHYLPGDLFGANIINQNRREFGHLFVDKFTELKGKKELGEGNSDCIIAKYVLEMDAKKENGEATSINEKNLFKVIEDLMGAGTETTSTTINWFISYMMHYPHIQEKLFEEIDSEIGEKLPSVADKTKLKYLNAVIMETQRFANVTPLAVNHMTSRDVTLNGFKIPKGTTVIPNITSVSFDKQIWGEDVDEFNPERFLDDTGNLKHIEEFIPFSIGRRACLGEALAKMELFLYMATLAQRFKFVAPDPKNLPGVNDDAAVITLTRSPLPFEVIIVDRRV